MAFYTDAALSPSWTERTFSHAARLLEAAATRHAKRRVYRTTLNELQALSNRELADLGFSRSGLRGIAREAVDRQTAW